jgi:ATP-dependent exoDNAse (exonuclease V) beta subunit
MWGLAISTWAEYAQAKRDAGVLDITDLQGEAVRLLEESPGVLQRYRKRFRYILVDEFQDTDPLQMRLVSLLHGERGGGGTAYANSLFIVGDAQQAIYGFRNADPTIFREQARRFREEAAGRHVTLAGNFRSRPEIIRFVNEAFARIWSRGETIHAPSTHGGEHEPKDCATVECLLARATDRGSYVATEAAALAEHIRTMVHSERVRRTHRGDRRCGEPVHYGDVAILLRALTQIETYERVFSERGIPYFVVGGGRGYYARMEIRDVANLLKTLDTPLDDIAVASALRSPMAGVDSDTLLALADLARSRREETGGRLYPAIPLLLDADALPADQAAMLEGFYMMSERLRGDLDRVPVGQLLECALAETQYDARLLVRPNGRRRLANVRKLLQMAFAKPDEGVSGFVRRLADLTQLSEREGDAPTEEEASDVVRFVSVHKAKGLEFPVVYVADMSRRQAGGPPDTFLCDPATMALGSKIGDYASLAHRVLSQRRKDADIAESTRLLYVAMTRAREHLVLCGATQGRSQGDTWAEMVFPQAGITYPQEPETRIGLGGVAMRLLPMEMLAAGNLA